MTDLAMIVAASAMSRPGSSRHHRGVKNRNQRSLLFATLVAASLPAPGAAHADAIDDLVTTELARSGAPGLSMAVVQGGRVVRVQGFGEANVEHGVPVHADTVFKTGAIGMPITAAAIMLLVEDGRMKLDEPVSRYLDGIPAKWSKVTVRHLLDHTSGIPATPNGDFRAEYTNAELLAIIAGQDINFAPGSRFRFSYANYIVLGMAIQQVTGEHWTTFVGKRLFAPLGMRTARGISEMAIVPNRAAGYEFRDGAMRNAEAISATANSTADGSLYLSALDYAAWGQALSIRGLLKKESWAVLDGAAKTADGATCGAAGGWFTEASGKERFLWQSGSWQGFQTYSLRYPARDLTVAVLANGETADVQAVARKLAAAVDPAVAGAPGAPLKGTDAAATARARALVEAIVAGKTERTAFVDFADLDYTELTNLYAGMLGGLGPIREFALFDKRSTCAETRYRYRARYDDAVMEVRLGLDAAGKVAMLDIVPVDAWSAPL